MPLLAPKEYVYSAEALGDTYDRASAEQYTRWLATHHYENFHVVTFLLPKRLHQDFYNVYAFCRWADDLGDEIGSAAESLRLLAWWRAELEAMYEGHVKHPVFVALEGTVHKYNLPMQLFADLISAFEQDQRITRYATWLDLFGYCRYSANPVGRLVLRLCGYADEELRPAFRRHLHGAAARQFLAGRHRGSGERPGLLTTGPAGPARLHARRAAGGHIQSGVPGRDARRRGGCAQVVPGRPAAGEESGPPPVIRSGSVQPRRHAGAGEDRAAELQRAGAPSRHLEVRARAATGWRTLWNAL